MYDEKIKRFIEIRAYHERRFLKGFLPVIDKTFYEIESCKPSVFTGSPYLKEYHELQKEYPVGLCVKDLQEVKVGNQTTEADLE